MATYVFKCRTCGNYAETSDRESVITCMYGHEEAAMVRDYRRENVGVTGLEQLKAEREAGSKEAYDRLFLPHNDDFKGPGDPDGTKGMRKWREEHQPRPTNKNPRWPGTVEKKVF